MGHMASNLKCEDPNTGRLILLPPPLPLSPGPTGKQNKSLPQSFIDSEINSINLYGPLTVCQDCVMIKQFKFSPCPHRALGWWGRLSNQCATIKQMGTSMKGKCSSLDGSSQGRLPRGGGTLAEI